MWERAVGVTGTLRASITDDFGFNALITMLIELDRMESDPALLRARLLP